jgi:hypothetical protein
MSKWIDKDLFDKFVQEKESEAERKKTTRRADRVWQTPAMGTVDKPRIYEGRFLPDPTGKFYVRYYYHGFRSGERWFFPLCEKTHDFYNWCPFCSITSKLYLGTQADKKVAGVYKRKERFVGNFYIVDDMRDSEKQDETEKVAGTVKLYEFPSEVETKLKTMVTDRKHGLGYSIFDPGDDGYNFIIKVRATKKAEDGKQWPVYSDSEFARKAAALGTEKQIKTIMESRFDLNEYVDSLRLPDEDIQTVLKNEMLWDLVKEEWSKHKHTDATEDEKKSIADLSDRKEEEPATPRLVTPKKSKKEEDDDGIPDFKPPKEDKDLKDRDLLKELDEL